LTVHQTLPEIARDRAPDIAFDPRPNTALELNIVFGCSLGSKVSVDASGSFSGRHGQSGSSFQIRRFSDMRERQENEGKYDKAGKGKGRKINFQSI
jgi:hypothetical protein